WVTGPDMDATYWYDNLRHPVRFTQAIHTLTTQGHHTYIETSPHPVLTHTIDTTTDHPTPNHHPTGDHPNGDRKNTDHQGSSTTTAVTTIGTLRRDESGPHQFLTALAHAHAHGLPITWHHLTPPPTAHTPTPLPTYPFQRRHYWLDATPARFDLAANGLETAGHPLLGAAVPLAGRDGQVFAGRIALSTHPWLADHTVMDTVLLPGTAFVDLALHAGREAGTPHLEELTLHAPLVVPERGGVQIQLSLEPVVEENGDEGAARRSLSVYARLDSAPGSGSLDERPGWVCHATGTLAATRVTVPSGSAAVWPPPGAEAVDLSGHYSALADLGFGYGPVFRGLRAAWRRGEEVFAEITLPEEDAPPFEGFVLHPALLDAALHAIPLAARPDGDPAEERSRLPFSWQRVEVYRTGVRPLRVRIAAAGPDAVAVTVRDGSGDLVAEVGGLVTRPLSPEQVVAARSTGSAAEHLYALEWVPEVTAATGTDLPSGSWAVVEGDPSGVADALAAAGASVDSHADLPALIAALDAGEAAPGRVVLTVHDWQTTPDPEPRTPAQETAHQARAVTSRLLGWLQTWLTEPRLTD
ncbi:polyketide synthase dehydratase domain-containing protein, partial [Streptomyces sp. NPDC018031]|uniref:polyketide synthase dehydratase domain-containing protein n=1 Tax=Streptomyces sp. NPDC018031 TaxID=3365033 RepID=UPI0037A6B4C6